MASREQSTKAIGKFVVYQVRLLVSDKDDNPRYMKAFDQVFKDLTGCPEFSRRIKESYDDRKLYMTFQRVGFDTLLAIFRNRKHCDLLRDLTLMMDVMMHLRKALQKQQKQRGLRNRKMMKEFDYFKNLYDRCIKRFRKTLGIKHVKNGYKNRFSSIKNFLKDTDDYDSKWGGFDADFGEFYNEDDSDEFDYEGSDEFANFIKKMASSSSSKPRRSSEFEDSLSDLLDDDYDFDSPKANQDIENLNRKMSEIEDALGVLIQKQQYNQVNPQPQYVYNPQPQPQQQPVNNTNNRDIQIINSNVNKLAGAVKGLMETVSGMQTWQEDISDAIRSMGDDDDDEPIMTEAETITPYDLNDFPPPGRNQGGTSNRQEYINAINTKTPPVSATKQE